LKKISSDFDNFATIVFATIVSQRQWAVITELMLHALYKIFLNGVIAKGLLTRLIGILLPLPFAMILQLKI
jgi:hypothetical protein